MLSAPSAPRSLEAVPLKQPVKKKCAPKRSARLWVCGACCFGGLFGFKLGAVQQALTHSSARKLWILRSIERPLQCFQLDLACQLRDTLLICRAADACAKGSKVGLDTDVSKNAVVWFAETWEVCIVQRSPFLTKETKEFCVLQDLARLVLMRIAWMAEGHARHLVCISTGTDNTASEAGVNKISSYRGLSCNLCSSIAFIRWAAQLNRRVCVQRELDAVPHHQSVLTLHPVHAPWHAEHRKAPQRTALKRGSWFRCSQLLSGR